MEFGTHCSLDECNRLDFLPIKCPACRQAFCDSHYLPGTHACSAPGASTRLRTEAAALVDPAARKAAATTARTPCPVPGCKRLTLHVEQRTPAGQASTSGASSAAAAAAGTSDSSRVFTHAAPRCYRCQGLFCPEHRVPSAHGCTAPAPKTEGQQKAEAADERKRRAQELLAKHFPSKSRPKKA